MIKSWICSKDVILFSNDQEIKISGSEESINKLKDKLLYYDIQEVSITGSKVEDIHISLRKTSSAPIPSGINLLLKIAHYIWSLFMIFRIDQKPIYWKERCLVIEEYHQLYLEKERGDVWKYIDLTTGDSGHYRALVSRVYIHPYVVWIYLVLRCVMGLVFKDKDSPLYSEVPYVVPALFLSLSSIKEKKILDILKADPNFLEIINEVKQITSNTPKVMDMLSEPIDLAIEKLKEIAKDEPNGFIGSADKLGLINRKYIYKIIEDNLLPDNQ